MGVDFLHRMYVLFLLLLLLLQFIGVPHRGFTGHFEAIMVLVFFCQIKTQFIVSFDVK